jgi:homogentisate 1,2-dioxygenase
MYRVRPSVMHDRLVPVEHAGLVANFGSAHVDPNQLRWLPMPMPAQVPAAAASVAATATTDSGSSAAAAAAGGVDKVDWVDGLRTMAGNGDPTTKAGLAIHMYACNASMEDAALYNSDGDFLIVPQEGTLRLQTEMGFLDVAPGEIAVVPRGIAFRVAVDGPSRGYVCEIYAGHFQLPDLGPIGANGLANPRDFLAPVAAYEDRDVQYVLLNKFGGRLFSTTKSHSPFNVVAWHGNYYPYKYDLAQFNVRTRVPFVPWRPRAGETPPASKWRRSHHRTLRISCFLPHPRLRRP